MADGRRRDEFGHAETLDMPAGEQVVATGEPPPGAAIGRFVVRRRLGQGGMGLVLAGEDADLGRPVAIKLVRSDADHPAYRARLLREAQAMARLEHPNVVKVYEVGEDRGRLFVAMEYIEGTTLTAWLAEHRPWRDIVAMFVQVGAGLAAAHRSGLVHRDFKPDNVLVDRAGRPHVADFGLARIETAEKLTQTGAMMGTPGYMAPEQQIGGDVDARADQYSFCVALREALRGRDQPRRLRDAIRRGLQFDPDERFASIDELLAVLRGAGRRRWLLGAAAIVALGAVAGGAVVLVVGTHAPVRSADAGVQVSVTPLPALPFDAAPVAPIDAAEVAAAPGDARATVRAQRHLDAAVAVAVTAAAPPALNVVMPHSQHKPEAQPGDPGHLPIVRASLKDLGYDGLGAEREAELQAEIDHSTGGDRAIAEAKLGMLVRRRGDCAAATQLWKDVATAIKGGEADPLPIWLARAWEGRALCSLGAGRPDEAFDEIKYAWLHGNQDDVRLVMAMATYDKGDKNLAYALFLSAESANKSALAQAALHAWLDGMGLSLR